MAVKPKTETSADTSVANPNAAEAKTMSTAETTKTASGFSLDALPPNLRLAMDQMTDAMKSVLPMLPVEKQQEILQAEAKKISESRKVTAEPLPKPTDAIELFFKSYLAAGKIPGNTKHSPNAKILRSKNQWNPESYTFRVAAIKVACEIFLEKGAKEPGEKSTDIYNAELSQSAMDALDDLRLFLDMMFQNYPDDKQHKVTHAVWDLIRKLGFINEANYEPLVGTSKVGDQLPRIPEAKDFAPISERLIMQSKIDELISLAQLMRKEWEATTEEREKIKLQELGKAL